MDSDRTLKRLYNRLNKKWFNSELPDVAVFYLPCHNRYAYTQEMETVEGETELVITIDPQIAALWEVVKCKMLHEMAHVKTWPNKRALEHGNVFWAEMDRLWNAGAFRREKCI